jgi:hypothetical protein
MDQALTMLTWLLHETLGRILLNFLSGKRMNFKTQVHLASVLAYFFYIIVSYALEITGYYSLAGCRCLFLPAHGQPNQTDMPEKHQSQPHAENR